LDEPTRSLDPLTARDLRSFLREELVGRMGMTIMLATHDAEEALSLSDRVSVLHRGRLVAEGAPAALSAELQLNRMRLVCRAEDMHVAMREAGVEGSGAEGVSLEGASAEGAGAEGEGARAESGALRSGLGLPAVVPAQSM